MITSEHVAGDAKEHFSRASEVQRERQRRYVFDDGDFSTDVSYIEGLDSLDDSVKSLVERIRRRHALTLLMDVVPFMSLDGPDIARGLLTKISAVT